jgi:hypothetical protein
MPNGELTCARFYPSIKVCLLAMPPYVAGPHSCADKFVPRHLSDGFGQLPFGHGDPLADQLNGSFLIGFLCKEIPHDSRFSLGIESRDPGCSILPAFLALCAATVAGQWTLVISYPQAAAAAKHEV